MERFQRSYILVGFGLLVSLAGLMAFCLRFLITKEILMSSMVALLIPLLIYGVCDYYRRSENYMVCSLLITMFSYLAVTIRIVKSGGLDSYFTAWYVGMTALSGLILTPKIKWAFWFLIIFTLFILYIAPQLGITLTSESQEGHKIHLYLLIMAVGLVGIITTIVDKEKEFFVRLLKVREKNEMVSEMVKMYNHEIINPITIAKGFLAEYRRHPNDVALIKVEQAINKIEKIVSEINSLSKINVNLEDYKKDFDHYQKLQKELNKEDS